MTTPRFHSAKIDYIIDTIGVFLSQANVLVSLGIDPAQLLKGAQALPSADPSSLPETQTEAKKDLKTGHTAPREELSHSAHARTARAIGTQSSTPARTMPASDSAAAQLFLEHKARIQALKDKLHVQG